MDHRTNGENDLRLTSVADGSTKTIAFGALPAFSADSRWAAVSVSYSEAQQDKMRKDKKPIRRKLTLVNLASGEMSTLDSVEFYAFSPDGKQLLLRHYAPERTPARGEPDPVSALDPEETAGVTAIVRDLATGRDTTFGNVAEATWQSKGRLLAIAIAAEDRGGNGVRLRSRGRHAAGAAGAARYLGLTWRRT
jgi:hypothetical protein